MLKRSSDLLKCFIEYETKVLSQIPMFHMPTLGDGYEAITRDGLAEDYVLPPDLELNVVSGFISVGGTMLQVQIDCMLVCGDGVSYGRTGKFIYEIEQVLCIFEVKKTLTKADMSDAIKHLSVIRKAFSEHFENKIEHENYIPEIEGARKRFEQITGREAPNHYYEINDIPKEDGLLFYVLVQEMIAPITIIHGYGGYKTEFGIRSAFLDLLEDEFVNGSKGYGVPSLPSLITSNEYCIIKGGGNPFVFIGENCSWVACGSTRFNSIEVILELVWSKISNYFKIKMPWDDGIYMNNVAPMLIATPKATAERAGWLYKTVELSEKELARGDDNLWEPIKLTDTQISIINLLAAYGGAFEASQDNVNYYLEKYNVDLDSEFLKLAQTQCFTVCDGVIKPINQVTLVLSLDNGFSYLSTDEDRLNSWCDINGYEKKYMKIVVF